MGLQNPNQHEQAKQMNQQEQSLGFEASNTQTDDAVGFSPFPPLIVVSGRFPGPQQWWVLPDKPQHFRAIRALGFMALEDSSSSTRPLGIAVSFLVPTTICILKSRHGVRSESHQMAKGLRATTALQNNCAS